MLRIIFYVITNDIFYNHFYLCEKKMFSYIKSNYYAVSAQLFSKVRFKFVEVLSPILMETSFFYYSTILLLFKKLKISFYITPTRTVGGIIYVEIKGTPAIFFKLKIQASLSLRVIAPLPTRWRCTMTALLDARNFQRITSIPFIIKTKYLL